MQIEESGHLNEVYLKSTFFYDLEHASIQHWLEELKHTTMSKQSLAIALYNMVRDGWRYNPYRISLKSEHFKASYILEKSEGNCVEKSILLIAAFRAVGIPARIHLGKVKNHIAVEKLTERFGTNELTPHGMVNAYINGSWLKMSPAFNASLCTMFDVEPLEFDGINDSYLQQYNSKGTKFMEYIEDYGHFEDVPLDFMKENLRLHYPQIFDMTDSKEVFIF